MGRPALPLEPGAGLWVGGERAGLVPAGANVPCLVDTVTPSTPNVCIGDTAAGTGAPPSPQPDLMPSEGWQNPVPTGGTTFTLVVLISISPLT